MRRRRRFTSWFVEPYRQVKLGLMFLIVNLVFSVLILGVFGFYLWDVYQAIVGYFQLSGDQGLEIMGKLTYPLIWGTALILVILAGVKPLERRFSRTRQAGLLMVVIDRRELSVFAIEAALEAAHLRLKHIRIQRGTAPDEDRLQIRLRRAPRPSVLLMAEQLRSLPGVREVRHTGS